MGVEFFETRNSKLSFSSTGVGEPMVLLMDFGLPGSAWMNQTSVFSESFQVITIDNRDSGYSITNDEQYQIEDLADDVVELLDHLSIDKAHIVGTSMGSFIAQEFALKYPERTRKLVLCNTTANMAQFNGITFASHFRDIKKTNPHSLPQTYALWNMTPKLLCNAIVMQHIYSILEDLLSPLSEAGYSRQAEAINNFNVIDRIHQITAPTMVMVSEFDILTPPRFGEEIANKIPHAHLATISHAGHGAVFETPEIVNRFIVEFVSSYWARLSA